MRPKLTNITIERPCNMRFDTNSHSIIQTYDNESAIVNLVYEVGGSAVSALLDAVGSKIWFVPDKKVESVVRHMIFGIEILPTPKKFISNNPATVILWEDGSKTVSKCKDEEFSTIKGALVCAFRKVTRNRKRIDNFEDVITELSNLDPEQMRTIADTLNVAADALEVACDSR